MEQCLALADYEATTEDEISFRRGDIINVTAKVGASGFWEGFVVHHSHVKEPGVADSTRGLFPNCLVSSNIRPQESPTFCNRALCLYDYTAADASEMSFKKEDRLIVVKPGPSQGWWFGVNEVETERLKAQKKTESKILAACGSIQKPLLFPSNFVTCKIVSVAFSFQSRHKYELPCDVGDAIQVHRTWNDGWWEGTLRGRRGIFPSNYTVPNVATTTPPLFCNICKTIFADGPLKCETCYKAECITQSMLSALEDYTNGKLEHMDLFAYVDMELVSGYGGKGLSDAAAAEGSVRRAAQVPMRSSRE